MVLRFRTERFKGYSVQYSPFRRDIIACVGATNFGLIGNGRLHLLNIGTGPEGITLIRQFDTQDGLFDVAWSEQHENQLATGSGDGSIAIWDRTVLDFPIQKWREHTREVLGLEWNYVSKTAFLSASWDSTIKLWQPGSPQSLTTFSEHEGCVYAASWCPHQNDVFASCSEDRTVKLWSINNPRHSIATISAHSDQVLSLDWNKYVQNQLVTTSSDKSIKVWDIRNHKHPVSMLGPFEFAMRRCKFSPYHQNILAVSGYNMAASVWDLSLGQVVYVHDSHHEFVFGLDWSLFVPGQLTTCAWDEWVHVFNVSLPGRDTN